MAVDHRTETVVVAEANAGERLDRVLAAAIAELSRTRLKALILAGEVDDRRPHNPRSGPSRQRRRYRHGRACRRRSRPSPRARTSRSISCSRTMQIIVIDKPRGPGGASRRRQRHRHAGQRADRPLRRQPVRHRRRAAAGHRAPARQGHHRPDGGGEDRPRPRQARRAVRRPRPHRAARARLSRLRLGRARPAQGHHRRSRSTAIRTPATRWRSRQGGREAITHWEVLERYPGRRTASRSRACSPAGWKPAAPTRSGSIWPMPATRCSATRSMARASAPRPPVCRPQAAEAVEALGRQALHAYLLAIEHPVSGQRLEFRSELPGDLARLRACLGAQAAARDPGRCVKGTSNQRLDASSRRVTPT